MHPGYGFLAESAHLAQLCAGAGLTWVGPSPEALALFGDKRATRQRAVELGVPVPAATELLDVADPDSALSAVRQLLAEHPDGIAIKAVAGGGGRGIRSVTDPDELERALTTCEIGRASCRERV